MRELSEQDLNNIQALHSNWIAKEVEGKGSDVVDLCMEDIQWLPPDSQPIVGREQIANYLASQDVKLLSVDISNLSVRGSRSVAYLTSDYRTLYSGQGHSQVTHEAKGTHLWILRKQGDRWLVAVVAWSSW